MSAAKEPCPACGKNVALTGLSALRRHRDKFGAPCPGSQTRRLAFLSAPLVPIAGPCPHGFHDVVCRGGRYQGEATP